MEQKTILTKHGKLILLEPGIIQFSVNENTALNLEDAKELHRAHLELSNQGKHGVYMNIKKFFIASKEVQKFSVSKEVTDFHIGTAILISNKAVRLLGSFFIKFYKSGAPTRIFNKEAEALEWLRIKLKEATAS